MDINIHDLKVWRDDARRELEREADRLSEKEQQISNYLKALDATEELVSEIDSLNDKMERQRAEIDDLSEQLEQKDKVIDDLRRQLLETKNQHLESEKQYLEAEANAKPMEIHNHFEPGSSSQVFNDKVRGKFTNKEKKKKRWKKIARKIL